MAGLSTLDIYNLALAELGGEQLSSIEIDGENSAVGKLCQNIYPRILDEALSSFDWSFARRRKLLARQSEPALPMPDYPLTYSLPSDCVRPMHLDNRERFIVQGLSLCTAASPAILNYVARVTEPGFYPPAFVSALAWALAAKLATARNNDPRKQELCRQNYLRAISQAMANDQNSHKPRPQSSSWLGAIVGGGGE